MRASQVFRYRTVQDGVTVEMVIWALPRPSAERKIFAKIAPSWRDGDGDEPDRD